MPLRSDGIATQISISMSSARYGLEPSRNALKASATFLVLSAINLMNADRWLTPVSSTYSNQWT